MGHRKRLGKILSVILAVSMVLTTNIPILADELAGVEDPAGATDDFILEESGWEELEGDETRTAAPTEILIEEDTQESETLSVLAGPAVSTVPDEDDGGVLPEDEEDCEITLMSVDDVPDAQEVVQPFVEMQIGANDPVQYSDQRAFIDALADASGDIRIKLLADVEVQGYVPVTEGQNVTFDLNGKTLSTIAEPENSERHYYVIQNCGTLTIKDTSDGITGTIRARGIENLENGYLTIESGKIIAIDQNGGAAIWNEAEVVVNGGIFETEYVGTASDSVGIGCLNNSGKATITGGTFRDVNKRTYAIISTGEIEITPAEGKEVTVYGAHGGLAIDGGTAVVNGGTYSSDDYYGLYVSNDGKGTDPQTAAVTVCGGTFSGNTYSVWIGSDYNNPVNSTIVIKGGTFNQPLNAQDVAREGAIAVSGGIFFGEVPEEYWAEGCILMQNEDGSYSVVEGDYIASVTDSEGNIQKYGSLSEAVNALQSNGTLTLLADVANGDYDNVINISLPSDAVLDGNGKTISGNVAVYVNAAGGTVKNVNFKNIHNSVNKLSAVYASSLTGTLSIIGCEFDTCDWDAIQTTPVAGAIISITGNTFRNTGDHGINTRRYVHVESAQNKDFSVTVTGNKFYDGDKLQETALEVYYPSDENKVSVNRNYFADPMGACIILKYWTNKFDLALPFVDETLENEVWPEASITRSSNCYYYFKLEDAIRAAATGNTITLRGNVERNDEVIIDNGKSLTLNLNEKTWKGKIGNNGTLTIAGESGDITGTIINNGTLTLSGNAAAGYSVENYGALNITGGGIYDLSKIVNGDEGSTVITGGTFTTEPDSSMLAEWYIANPLDDASGQYKVAKMTLDQAREAGMVASSSASGGTYYKTVSEAVAANNLSAYLQKDVQENIVATRISTKYYGYIYANGHKLTGSLDINSEYTGTNTKYFCLRADQGGSIELDSTKFNGDFRVYDGTVVLDYAEAPSMTVATYNTAAQLTLKDAKVPGTVDVAASGTLNIEGGKYGTLQTHVYYKAGETEPTYASVLNVTGGTFDSNMVTVAYTNHTLEGGLTSEQVPLDDYIPEGYEVVNNSDNTYTVKAKAVASIGENMYASLEAAIDAVQSGEIIKLLADVALPDNTPLTISGKGAESNFITLDLNGHMISGSNQNTGLKAGFSTSGGILLVSSSYVNLTDNSSGKKGSIVNTYNTAAALSMAVLVTQDGTNSGQLTINGGVTIDNQNASVSSKAIYVYGATKVPVTNVTVADAVVKSGGYTVYTSMGKASAAINGGEYTSTGKGNTVTALQSGGSGVTINGGIFHNWGLADSGKVNENSYICIAESGGNREITVRDTVPTDYSAQVEDMNFYMISGNLYELYYLGSLMTSGGGIIVKKNASFTFPETAATKYFGNSSGAPKVLSFNLSDGVVLSGSMMLGIADVTVTGSGTVDQGFFGSYTGYEMTKNGEDGLYCSRLSSDSAVAEVIQDDGTVLQYSVLSTAVKEANGKQVKLLNDIIDVSKISISGEVTIDLNRHTIGFGTDACFYVSGGSLTLTGEGKVYEQAPNYGPVVVKGSSTDKADYSVVSIGEKVILEGWAGVFIDTVTGGHGYGIDVTVDGTINGVRDTSGALGSGIYINGQIQDLTGNVPKITLSETSNINSAGNGIYAAGYAEWKLAGNVTGSGGEALSIKSGTFNITGGTYTAKGAFADPAVAQGSGSEATGAVLSVTSNDGYAKKVEINVIGGTFVSENGYAVYEGIAKKSDGSSAAESSYASLAISGGTFTGNNAKGAVNITTAENKNVISSGIFSSDVSEYCVVGKEAVLNGTDGTYVIETAKYDVMLYSSLMGGQVTGIATLTGGGMDIAYNEPVTVTAPSIDRYQFMGWYNVTSVDTTGDATTVTYDESQTVSTVSAYTFNIKQDTTLVAVYKAVKKVTLDVSAADFKVNGEIQQGSSYHNQFDIGTEITVEHTGSDTFHYWKNGSDKIVSTSNPYTFTIVSDTKITVLTTKDGSEADVKSAYVEFVSAYDQVLQAGAWYGNKTANDYSLPAGPSKFGGTFLYWSLDGMNEATVKGILAKVAEGTETCITVRPVYKLTEKTHTVTVIYSAEEKDVYTKTEGEGLNVRARDIEGQIFSHWSDQEDGSTVLSYNQEYFMVVGKNITLYAIYSDTAVEKQPVITITNAYSSTVDNVNKVSFEATRNVPEGYMLIEHGVIYGTRPEFAGNTGNDKLVVDGTGVFRLTVEGGALQGVYTAHIPIGTYTTDVVYARGYMTVKDSQGVIKTYYTNIASGSFDSLPKVS